MVLFNALQLDITVRLSVELREALKESVSDAIHELKGKVKHKVSPADLAESAEGYCRVITDHVRPLFNNWQNELRLVLPHDGRKLEEHVKKAVEGIAPLLRLFDPEDDCSILTMVLKVSLDYDKLSDVLKHAHRDLVVAGRSVEMVKADLERWKEKVKK